MKSPLVSPLIVAACLSAVLPVKAVEVDPSFNPRVPDGTVRAIITPSANEIFVGGEFAGPSGVVKLNEVGSRDTTFAGVPSGSVYTMGLGANGTLYVGGGFREGIARLNPSGAIDTTFQAASPNGRVWALVTSQSEHVMVGGSFWSQPGTFAARLTQDGAVASDFRSALKPNFSLEAGVTAMALQTDGKVLVGGNFDAGSEFSTLARLNPDGTIDPSFAPDGATLYLKAISLFADGRIAVAGTRDSSGNGFVRVLNPNGTLDASFQEAVLDQSVEALAVDDSGQILLGGSFTQLNGAPAMHLARLRSDGTADPDWNMAADGVITAIVIDGQGRILVGGGFREIGGIARAGLARLVTGTSSFAFKPLAISEGGEMHLSLKGDSGRTYVVESSTDLRGWTVYKTNLATIDGLAVSVNGAEAPRKFFRARLSE